MKTTKFLSVAFFALVLGATSYAQKTVIFKFSVAEITDYFNF